LEAFEPEKDSSSSGSAGIAPDGQRRHCDSSGSAGIATERQACYTAQA
jgi:hypothetical protein